VANRADKSISVLSIQGNDIKLIDTVAMGDEVASVAITPDGKRALATKFPAHKIALLTIEGRKVTDTKQDMPVGLWPYNIDITPNARSASAPTMATPARRTAISTPSASSISNTIRPA